MRELYWEYSRVAKRGAGTYTITDDQDQPLELATLIEQLDREKTYRIVREDWSELDIRALQGEAWHPPARLALQPREPEQPQAQVTIEELQQRLYILEERVDMLHKLLEEHGILVPAPDQNHGLGCGGAFPAGRVFSLATGASPCGGRGY